MGSGRSFAVETRLGAGAYICGGDTSLLESLKGKRGIVLAKPPLPALKGLFGLPTIVNDVLSFASAPWIMEHGAEAGLDPLVVKALRVNQTNESPSEKEVASQEEVGHGSTPAIRSLHWPSSSI